MERRTPLFDEHRAAGARMAPFAGWMLPIRYGSILEEHDHTRHAVSVFDTCHMGEFDLEGPVAAADLDRLITCSVAPMTVGRCRYGYLLDERGGVIDDLTCYRLGPERFRLVVNAGTAAGDAEWIRRRLSAGTRFVDVSDRMAKLDVQGPVSRACLEKALGDRVPDLGFFRCAEARLGGIEALLSRTGYTGEWGYELYLDPDSAVDLWRRLVEAGAAPAGLGARDTLRLEMGYPLYGHELTRDRTPAGVAGGAFLDLGKPFIGRDAVVQDGESGPAARLVGLRLSGRRAARAGARILASGRAMGVVTSGAFAPSLGAAVAMGWVDAAYAEEGTSIEIECRGQALAAVVSALPFYLHGTARKAVPERANPVSGV